MTALVIDSGEIRSIRHRTVNPSRFTMLASRINRAAKVIKEEWNNFSVEDREALKSLAYDWLKPPKGVSRLWLKLWISAYMLWIKATGQEEPFCNCVIAVDCLVDNILDAIEQEHPYYKQTLSDTLEELDLDSESGDLVDAQGREWLKQLSDQALTEV